MIRRLSLFVLMGSLLIGQPTSICAADEVVQVPFHNSGSSQTNDLSITGARLEGNKLIVSGTNFHAGAMIQVNGRKQNTVNDLQHPSTLLIAAEAAKSIARGEIVMVKIENPGGAVSKEMGFFFGRVVTLEDNDKTIRLKAGQKFLLYLKNEPYSWTAIPHDEKVIQRTGDSSCIPGSQGLFEALREGRTGLIATGELPCHKATPPCMAATLSFKLMLLVQ